MCSFFFFNDTATTEIYTLSLHDALPIYPTPADLAQADPEELERLIMPTGFYRSKAKSLIGMANRLVDAYGGQVPGAMRSEEHTSELQSRQYLVCRLLLEKKKHNAENASV